MIKIFLLLLFSLSLNYLHVKRDDDLDNQDIVIANLYKNKAAYWLMRTNLIEKGNKGKFVLISKEKVAAIQDTLSEIKIKDNKLQDPSSYIAFIGHEKEIKKEYSKLFKDILPINPQKSMLNQTLLSDLHHNNTHVVWSYNEDELKVIDEKDFKQHYGYTERVKMKSSQVKGVPLTFLIDTGSQFTIIHEKAVEVLQKLGTRSTTKYIINGLLITPAIVRRSQVEEDQRFEGINILGTDVISAFGLNIEPLSMHDSVIEMKADRLSKPQEKITRNLYQYSKTKKEDVKDEL